MSIVIKKHFFDKAKVKKMLEHMFFFSIIGKYVYLITVIDRFKKQNYESRQIVLFPHVFL